MNKWNFIILDDPVNPENEPKKSKVIKWWNKTMKHRLKKKSPKIFIKSRIHNEDLPEITKDK